MFLVIKQSLREIVAIRIPGPDVGVVKFEDPEAGVAREHRIFGFYFGSGAAQALFGEFCDGAWFTELAAKISGSLLILILWIEWFWKLDENIATTSTVSSILRHDGVAGRARTGKKINHQSVLLWRTDSHPAPLCPLRSVPSACAPRKASGSAPSSTTEPADKARRGAQVRPISRLSRYPLT